MRKAGRRYCGECHRDRGLIHFEPGNVICNRCIAKQEDKVAESTAAREIARSKYPIEMAKIAGLQPPGFWVRYGEYMVGEVDESELFVGE